MELQQELEELECSARRAREATRRLAFLPTAVKNRALRAVAAALRDFSARVIAGLFIPPLIQRLLGMTPGVSHLMEKK